jgi:hypothetical protein
VALPSAVFDFLRLTLRASCPAKALATSFPTVVPRSIWVLAHTPSFLSNLLEDPDYHFLLSSGVDVVEVGTATGATGGDAELTSFGGGSGLSARTGIKAFSSSRT